LNNSIIDVTSSSTKYRQIIYIGVKNAPRLQAPFWTFAVLPGFWFTNGTNID